MRCVFLSFFLYFHLSRLIMMMSSDKDDNFDTSHCVTIPNQQQLHHHVQVPMKDGIPFDSTSSVSPSEDVTDGCTGANVSETLPCSSSPSTSLVVQNETVNLAESNSTGRNDNMTRILLKAAADIKREAKMRDKAAHLNSKFEAASLPRSYNQVGNFSSVANPRCHASPSANYRTNGTISSVNDRFMSTYKSRRGESETSVGPNRGPPCHYNNFPLQSTATKDEYSLNDRFLSTDKLRSGDSEISMEPTRGRQGHYNNFPLQSTATKGEYSVNDRFLSTDKLRSGEFEMSMELTRGPRGHYNNFPLQSSATKDDFAITICRDKCNQSDFQTEYETAKFYVIKSFNEDDVHKSVKYDVWTSTPIGNKKLNDAFHNAEEAKSIQRGIKCPIFLFFSVNASRQFVGVAEMLGPVDYKKDMEFWKLDKYNGFFPIRWHIIKDVPNNQFRHIILENNDNRPVTFTRDTQEVGLKQGLEMLNIFKSYPTKTSLLDDFDFYEQREKLLHSQRRSKHIIREPEVYGYDNYQCQLNTVEAREKKIEMQSSFTRQATLVNLTKNLSLNPSGKQGFR